MTNKKETIEELNKRIEVSEENTRLLLKAVMSVLTEEQLNQINLILGSLEVPRE